MDHVSRVNDKSTDCQKENSPPCAVDVRQDLPGATRTKTTADIFSLNNGNQGQAAAFKPFQENLRKSDNVTAQQLQQPLQPRNNVLSTNKQGEKVQPELLTKFRQLRQWQRQQQESMFKQQQEQMATLKMQQDKLQSLYQKAVTTTVSPSMIANSPGDCQRLGKDTPVNNINAKEMNKQKRDTSLESFLKTLKTQGKLETCLVNPAVHAGNQDVSPTSKTSTTSPVLMTPMQFMSPSPYGRSYIGSPEDFRLIGAVSTRQNAESQSPNAALQRRTLHKPEYNGDREYEVIEYDDQSDLESQPDYQSDAETMSGVYPLQDDMSEACTTEMENEQRNLDFDEESDEERHSDLESTVRERINPNQNKDAIDDEDRPINPGIGATKAATFEELLEKELTNELNNQFSQKSPSPVKPQSKFLRRGQGLARFNMKPTGLKKHKTANQKTSASLPPSQQVFKTQKADRNNVNSISMKQETKGYSKQLLAVPQNKQVQRKIAGRTVQCTPQEYGSSVLASRVIGPFSSMVRAITKTTGVVTKTTGAITKSTGAVTKMTGAVTKTIGAVTKTTLTSMRREAPPLQFPFASLDVSLQKRGKQWEDTHEDEDLEEFEMLEQAAANASFSSNSSLVVKVLDRARWHTPGTQTDSGGKTESITSSRDSQVPSVLSPVDTGYGSGLGEGRSTGRSVIAGSRVGSWSSAEDGNTTDNESTEEEDDNDTTLREMDDAESSPPGNQIPKTNQPLQTNLFIPTGSCEAPVQPSNPVLTSQDEFDDQEAWGEIRAQSNPNDTDSDEDSDDTDDTISDVFPMNTSLITMVPQPRDQSNRSEHLQTSSPGNRSDVTSTPPTSALVSKLFPKLKPKTKVEENQIDTEPTVSVVADSGPSKEVQEKLQELEEEINKFRAENKALAKIRSERDEGLKRLQKEIDSFEKQKSEELERLEKFQEEEMQKLRRERRTFEKYQKAARNNPDKKEREEIETLRSQVAELQEEIKRRESRWSAANSRHRNRIEALEEQNKELQEEVKLLEKNRLEKWRHDEMKAKDNEEARPREVVLRKTIKPAEPARNDALIHQLNYEVLYEEETTRQSPQQKTSPMKQNETTTPDINNNKTKVNDSITLRPSPSQGKILAAKGPTEGERAKSEPDPSKLQEQQAGKSKTEDKTKRIQSVIPGMRKLDLQEIEHPDGKVEHVKPDGSRVIMFGNGTRKEISTDGQTVIVSFFNGDIKQVFPDQRVVYYYSDAKTTHTTYPDGLEVLQFPNNQVEKHYVDGTKEIIFPDQTIKYLYVDGTEECVFADGTIQRMRGGDGERIIEFPNGQREVHTKHYKRRDYPDGTVKTVYPDGRTETRYSTGRLRVKDRDGRVLVDTAERLPQKE